MQDLDIAYARARKRLLLLDYDGTLIEFNDDPTAATPNAELRVVLGKLTDDPANTVVVVSGRPGDTLEEWLGSLPLGFSAEHGFLHKKPGSKWETVSPVNDDWKAPVRKLLQHYIELARGTILEEKVSALTWHWRAADDPDAAAQLEQRLLAELEKLASPLHIRVLRIIRGNKVIEVHPDGFDKGTAANYWLAQDKYDFVLAAGDDTTDEDLFHALPKDSFIIKVGPGESLAQLRVDSPAAMRAFLDKLVTS